MTTLEALAFVRANYTAENADCACDRALLALAAAVEPALAAIETAARQNCHTGKVERDYNGQVAGTLVTDSGAITADAELLYLLAEYKRFRIVAAGGRMVVGYWPEHDPAAPAPSTEPPP